MDRGHVPIRMCVICRRRAPRHELTRHVLPPNGGEPAAGGLQVDERQRFPGRGWYVCADEKCKEQFLKFRAARRKRKGESA